MSNVRDDAVDRLLHRVDREVLGAVADAFDLDAGLAQVRRKAAREPATRKNTGQRVLVTAVARMTTIVEEAERLSTAEDGWEGTARRFDEIATQWLTIQGADSGSEKVLWRRYVAAREEFAKRPAPTVAVDPPQVSRSVPDTATGSPGDGERLTIEAAEQLLWRRSPGLAKSGRSGTRWPGRRPSTAFRRSSRGCVPGTCRSRASSTGSPGPS
jgi:hypothetical protein